MAGASGPRATARARGACFTFTLPVADRPAGEGARHAPKPEAPRHAGARPRILILDDDPQTLRFVRDALAEVGYDPVVTGDPYELPGLLETVRPDLMLPDTDGIELMRRVHPHGSCPLGPNCCRLRFGRYSCR